MGSSNLYTIAIPALPLLGFVIALLWPAKKGHHFIPWINTVFLAGALGLSIYSAYKYFFNTPKLNGQYLAIKAFDFDWLTFNQNLKVTIGGYMDSVSVMMLLVVTLVSFMVHLYSIGYMHGDRRINKFFSFLGLFTFSMLMLVLSTNIIELYIFWELVGVSSFLLIGYYYEKPSAVAAAKKAFIVTRFADMFFLIGILILSSLGHSLDIPYLTTTLGGEHFSLSSAASQSFLGLSVISWAMTLIFIGGAGKSAMFPLHIWLPDAMEGPTPVSALIHAATMVVAGVYLVARLFPIYAFTVPGVLQAISYIGAFTALFAAIIACTQFDLKRILAYSTMSQIGFMLFAIGLAGFGGSKDEAFTASQFHLFTHAIFKALLFLSAGVIIHYTHENDIRKMGRLRKNLPIVHLVFFAACLAIAGIPPFAGFFSKEMILSTAYSHNKSIYITGALTSGLTAFYMFRLYYFIFWRDLATEDRKYRSHRFSPTYIIPLLILALGTITAGFIPFTKYVTWNGTEFVVPSDWIAAVPVIVLSVLGILAATYIYSSGKTKWAKKSVVFKVVYHKFYVDEIWEFITRRIIFLLVAKPANWFDRNIVNGVINGFANVTLKFSKSIKGIQSGSVQSYIGFILAGVILLAIFINLSM